MMEAPPKFCASCGSALAPLALSCPQCSEFVYSAEMDALALQAREKESAGDAAGAGALWRQVLALLPPDTKRAEVVRERIARLRDSADAGAIAAAPAQDSYQESRARWTKRLGPLGVVVAFLLKFKTVLLLGVTKAKFLLLGLSKLSTFLSMFATFGVYWTWYGWKFALGFVLGIYVHEMGHVWRLRQYGLRASAPMFIPGFGAFVSLYDSPANLGEDARIGLAGPLWGAGAGVAALLPAMLAPGSGGVWMAVAHFTAYINLFNLIPVWQLDGGRAWRALNFLQRLMLLVLMGALFALTREGIFVLLLLGALYRIFVKRDHAPQPDQGVLVEFAGLLILFAAMLALIPAYPFQGRA
jgi:Zn-dependent protease